MKKVVLVLIVTGIVPSLFLSSCKKEVDCPGLPVQLEGYFPSVGELKFSNGLGDYKVFGDTLDIVALPVSSPRFTEALIVYGLGVVKLHDVMNNCDWTRVW